MLFVRDESICMLILVICLYAYRCTSVLAGMHPDQGLDEHESGDIMMASPVNYHQASGSPRLRRSYQYPSSQQVKTSVPLDAVTAIQAHERRDLSRNLKCHPIVLQSPRWLY